MQTSIRLGWMSETHPHCVDVDFSYKNGLIIHDPDYRSDNAETRIRSFIGQAIRTWQFHATGYYHFRIDEATAHHDENGCLVVESDLYRIVIDTDAPKNHQLMNEIMIRLRDILIPRFEALWGKSVRRHIALEDLNDEERITLQQVWNAYYYYEYEYVPEIATDDEDDEDDWENPAPSFHDYMCDPVFLLDYIAPAPFDFNATYRRVKAMCKKLEYCDEYHVMHMVESIPKSERLSD